MLQQSIKLSLEPLFDPDFSENSFGFRPGKGQQRAITQAKDIVNEGKDWIVDSDLEKFFDTINHDKVIHLLKRKVKDKRVIRLIGMTLRSGIMAGEKFIPSDEGSVQGSPLSPLLSNIVLDELDKELEKRGLSFCRFADDCDIFVGSQKAGNRVMASMSRFIEKRLKLKINQKKSKVAPSQEVKFLGLTIINKMVLISKKSTQRAKAKLRELIPRRTHLPWEERINRVNQWYVGWSAYYRLTEFPRQLKEIEGHIRRRFRSQLINQCKSRRSMVRRLPQLGISKTQAGSVYGVQGRWKLSHLNAVEKAWNNQWFTEQGLKTISHQQLDHWKPLSEWIRLT